MINYVPLSVSFPFRPFPMTTAIHFVFVHPNRRTASAARSQGKPSKT